MPREASPKQKALLRFIGVSFQEPISSADASRLIDEAIESDTYRERLDEWNTAKLKLHPTLYADEVAARKAGRADSIYYEVTDETMRNMLNRVTKAEVSHVIAHLDQHSTGWDDDPVKRIYEYFLPALQRLYPKCIKQGFSFDFPAPNRAQKSSSSGCFTVHCALVIFSYIFHLKIQ